VVTTGNQPLGVAPIASDYHRLPTPSPEPRSDPNRLVTVNQPWDRDVRLMRGRPEAVRRESGTESLSRGRDALK